jgi:lysophospholipase L1-like esterase
MVGGSRMKKAVLYYVLTITAFLGLLISATGGAAAARTANAGSARVAGSTAPCFQASYPDCSSSNPSVAFEAASNGDTTGCEFQKTIAWGDGTTNEYTYPGGSNGAVLYTFTHTYPGQPGTYTIQVTGQTTTGSCSSFSATLEFTLLPAASPPPTSPPPNGPPPGSPLTLAALGDSYSSGNGTPDAVRTCYRSPQAWPELVPEDVGGNAISPSVTLLACSGANSTGAYSNDLPAQEVKLQAITPAPGLVTLTIGGNDGTSEDAGLFNVLKECFLSELFCANAAAKELSWLSDREAAILEKDFDAVKQADPSAVLLVVGYPQIFPDEGWCRGFTAPEVEDMNELTVALDDTISAAAAADGVRYVPTISAFNGHDLCSDDPYVVAPYSLSSPLGWFHPNVEGQKILAGIVAEFITSNHLATS